MECDLTFPFKFLMASWASSSLRYCTKKNPLGFLVSLNCGMKTERGREEREREERKGRETEGEKREEREGRGVDRGGREERGEGEGGREGVE